MNALERLAFDAAMEAWRTSRKRPDLDEEARVKGALLAYQRQVIAVEVVQATEDTAKRRARRVKDWVDGGGSSWGVPMQDIEALAVAALEAET